MAEIHFFECSGITVAELNFAWEGTVEPSRIYSVLEARQSILICTDNGIFRAQTAIAMIELMKRPLIREVNDEFIAEVIAGIQPAHGVVSVEDVQNFFRDRHGISVALANIKF